MTTTTSNHRAVTARQFDDALSLRLLERLMEGDLGVGDLARELQVTLRDLGQWMIDASNAEIVAGLLRLAEARAAMLVSRYRALAAAVLAQIIHHEQAQSQSSDLLRKACVDMLRVEIAAADPARTERHTERARRRGTGVGDEIEHGPHAPSEEAILRALQRIGERP